MIKAEAAPNVWSEARKRMLTQPGHIYAAYSKGECWIKLGFSLDVDRRLGEINSRFHQLAPFTLIGKTPSVYAAERQMHRILGPFRHRRIGLSRELYLAMPAVEKIVKAIVEGVDRPAMDYREVHVCATWAINQAHQQPIPDLVRDLYRTAHYTNYRELP
jgi:hypothetical protein